MRQNTKVTFAMRDLDRLKCIQAVVDGDLKPIRAADRLGLTTRQVRRLARRYARGARRFDLQALQPAEQQPHG
jgi:transcriptional regulator with GAF, ATPase, and Fis domain